MNNDKKSVWDFVIEFGHIGKGTHTGCSIFARSLFDKLKDNDIPCAVVYFKWKDFNGLVGAHEVLVYKDEQDRAFWVDAMATQVKFLPSDILLNGIPSWTSPHTSNWDIQVIFQYKWWKNDAVTLP